MTDGPVDPPPDHFTRPAGVWVDPPRWRRATAFARRRPAFLIIGAQRAGTTSLYRTLSRHPRIHPALRKEVHYLDFQYAKGRHWYGAHFPLRGPGLTGEASPYYMVHPLAPNRARALNPDMKLIAILRDPVDRAWSHYNHEVRHGVETLTFEQALDAEPGRLAVDAHRLREAPHYFSYNHHHFSYLDRGRYGHYLAQWLDRFPREQLHVVRADAMFENPNRVIDETLRFLALSPAEFPGGNPPHANKAPPYPPLEPNLRARLEQHFESDAKMLDQLLP